MDKKTIRNKIKEEKKNLTKETIREWSQEIWNHFYRLSEYQSADLLYCYMSYNQEVETRIGITRALEEGKKIAVPKIITPSESEIPYMEFFSISSLNEIEPGYQKIPEPVTKTMIREEGILLMPGLAFDEKGHRIGYGGGFYDRYLHEHRHNTYQKIALCFDFQVLEEFETEPFDETVSLLITPTRIIKTKE